MEDITVRLSIELPNTLRDRLNNMLPWGIRGAVMRAVIERTVEAIEIGGLGVVDLILNERLHPSVGLLREERSDVDTIGVDET